MDQSAKDYEKLGVFYLGREFHPDSKKTSEAPLLYDSKDLTTHGVVLGMTGSGKTGLCIALLEEAAMDGIPAIVIDPKGDIANLALTFPELRGTDFRPWINEEDAEKTGLGPDEFAEKTAETWRKGLADWGQGPDRIATLREKAEVTIFTPGSRSGIPVSILGSLEAPPFEVADDPEMLGDRIESTVASLLSLVGVDADPIKSRQAVLLANIFGSEWREGRGLTIESLIRHIQKPSFGKVGVIDLESFLDARHRQELALRFNNLLASPGFSTWLEGAPLNVGKLLHAPDGKPRISVFSIAHLSDTERMFFVSLLLSQMLGWMRTQSGTTSLRAILYMDEIFGFLPPVSNPPSKKPLMTLLKQGRAFGLGCLLATQNPVDLDYKALSNIGTWFLGRLQTERDKMRVLDGLEGAAASREGGIDRSKMERLLSGLGKRIFVLNNVHENGPVIFSVRWVMSFLRGPLTRTQIKKLMDPLRAKFASGAAKQPAANPMAMPGMDAAPAKGGERPAVGHGVAERFLPVAGEPEDFTYRPMLLRAGTVHFSSAKTGVDGSRTVRLVNPMGENGIDWKNETPLWLPVESLSETPKKGVGFANLPGYAMNGTNYKQVSKDFAEWLYRNERATVFHSKDLKEYSKLGEAEGEFRARLAHKAREARDEAVEKLRASVDKKLHTMESRLRTAEGRLSREKTEASSAKMQAGVSILGSLLGGLLGRKSRRVSTSLSRATSAYKQQQDVGVAAEKVEDIQQEIARIQQDAKEKTEEIRAAYETSAIELESVSIKPTRRGVQVDSVALMWMPEERK
jgi:hypothetical protein